MDLYGNLSHILIILFVLLFLLCKHKTLVGDTPIKMMGVLVVTFRGKKFVDWYSLRVLKPKSTPGKVVVVPFRGP